MKSTSPLVALVFFVAATVASTVSAQDLIVPQVLTQRIDEALLFSNVQPMGSARFMGTGGSMTAIGVDATTLHTNPGRYWLEPKRERFPVRRIYPSKHPVAVTG